MTMQVRFSTSPINCDKLSRTSIYYLTPFSSTLHTTLPCFLLVIPEMGTEIEFNMSELNIAADNINILFFVMCESAHCDSCLSFAPFRSPSPSRFYDTSPKCYHRRHFKFPFNFFPLFFHLILTPFFFPLILLSTYLPL